MNLAEIFKTRLECQFDWEKPWLVTFSTINSTCQNKDRVGKCRRLRIHIGGAWKVPGAFGESFDTTKRDKISLMANNKFEEVVKMPIFLFPVGRIRAKVVNKILDIHTVCIKTLRMFSQNFRLQPKPEHPPHYSQPWNLWRISVWKTLPEIARDVEVDDDEVVIVEIGAESMQIIVFRDVSQVVPNVVKYDSFLSNVWFCIPLDLW